MAPLNIKNRLEDDILDLSMMSLKEVPLQEIVALKKKVKQLDLSNNEIETLPKYFATSLGHITKLDLGSNKLTQLPANFGDLTSLKHLDLYNNQLTDLPLSFADLQELKWIDLKSNSLRKDFSLAAGDCSDYKECSAAAKNILLLSKKLKKDYEHQQLMKQTKEKEMEKARLQKEQEKNRKKNDKKQAMENQKKQEQKESKKSSQPSTNGAALTNGHKKNQNNNGAKANVRSTKNVKKTSSGLSCLAWINFVLFILLLISASLCIYVYSEGDFSVAGGKKALEKLETNFSHLVVRSKPHVDWAWAEMKVLGGRASQVSSICLESVTKWSGYALKSVEGVTGDLSPMTAGIKKSCISAYDVVISYILYAAKWSENLLDKKFWFWVAAELKYFGQFLWAQILVVWEEIGNNTAMVALWKDCGGIRKVFWNASSSVGEMATNLYIILKTKVVPEVENQFDMLYNWVVHSVGQVSS